MSIRRRNYDVCSEGISSISRYPADVGIFPQVSGIFFTIDSSAQAGKRVVSVEVNGKPLDLTQKYSLAVTNFMHMGGDGYSMLVNAPLLGEYGLADDVLAAYNYKWSDRPSGTTKEQGQDYTRLLSTGQNDSHHTYFAELPYIQLSPFANYPPTLLFPEQTFPEVLFFSSSAMASPVKSSLRPSQ